MEKGSDGAGGGGQWSEARRGAQSQSSLFKLCDRRSAGSCLMPRSETRGGGMQSDEGPVRKFRHFRATPDTSFFEHVPSRTTKRIVDLVREPAFLRNAHSQPAGV